MFPSAGYFRSANCPFFIHGLCHRPYCHFRHAKPGQGSTSKSTVKSCLKSKVPASNTEITQDGAPRSPSPTGPIASHIKPAESVTEKDQLKNPDTKNESKSTGTKIVTSDKEPQTASHTKSVSLLESLNKLEQAVEEASASLHSSACGSKKISSLVSTKCRTTQENKALNNMILKTTTDADNVVSQYKSTDFNTNIQENMEVCSKAESPSVIPSVDKTGKKQKSSQEILPKNPQLLTENSSSSLEEMPSGVENSNDDLKNVNEPENVDKELGPEVMESHIGAVSGKRKFDITNEEDSVLPARKRKMSHSSDDIQKKVKDKTAEKSSADIHVHVEEIKVSIKSKKEPTKNRDKRKLSDELKLKKVKESLERTKIASTSSKQEIKRKDKVKDLKLEKADQKEKRKLVDIDFFTSPKKSKSKAQGKESVTITESASDKVDEKDKVELKTFRKHNKVRSSNYDQCVNKDNKVTETSRTGERSKNKANTNISIDSLFESDEDKGISSDNISDSEHDTVDSGNETLKEIFDNYDPQQEKTKRLSVDNIAGTSGLESVEVSLANDRKSSLAELPGLGKKKRVAHNASYLVQRKTSNLNPIRRLPKDAPSIPAKQTQPTTLERNAIQSKKRVAHVPKPTTETSLARPRIPIEYGAKVPQNLRQRYLDKIIDENLRLYATEKEAFEKGIEEERGIYYRATRRPMYLNLCCNAIKVLRSKPTPDFQTDPSPPTNIACPMTTTGLSKDMKKIDSKRIDASKLTEEMTYELLSQYIMTEEQLVDNGYPRPSPSSPGKVTFKPRRPPPTPSKDPNRRTCCRCGKNYSVREDGTYVRQEDCVYHVGRLFRRRTAGEISSSYQCCGGDASTPGCAVCKYHVSEGKNATEGFMTTIINPLAGNRKKVFGLDCEMCYTLAGLELTRVTVVDWKLEKIYDTFVKPDSPILDYNTRFSGVTQECLRGVKTSIREVQAVLLSMISKDSILVGHSLESDLLSLKLVHDTVVDTSVVFPHRLGPPYKRALRTLMAEFVKKIIQNNEEGHDSYEDAKASLELMLFKIKEDLKKKPKNRR